MSERRAEVVGGGIVGLGAAALLARAGWSVRVHERSREIREVGAAIGIRGGGLHALRELGVIERLGTDAIVLAREERRDATGAVLVARDRNAATTSRNPLRQELVNALIDAVRDSGAELRTGSLVRRADPDGTIAFADGSEATADLVVAADGFRSRIRFANGLEREARLFHSGTTRVLMPREGEPSVSQEWWSGRLRIGIAPTKEDTTYVFLSAPEADAHASAVPIDADYWAQAFPGLPRSFFDRVEAAGGVRHLYPLVRCHSWAKGRLVLLGDAAHALPSTLGLGASMGLTNAYDLVRALEGSPDVPAALAAWDARRRPLAEQTQRWAKVYDALTVRCPRRLDGVRNGFVKLLDVPAVHRRVFQPGALALPDDV